jgi:UDP-glucose 4-epimerase
MILVTGATGFVGCALVQYLLADDDSRLVSDGEDVSTTDLLCRILCRPARLVPVPASWLKLAAAMVGKSDVAQRLCGSLQVDISKTRKLLGWTPPVSLDEGLRRAAGNTGLPRFARNDGRGP